MFSFVDAGTPSGTTVARTSRQNTKKAKRKPFARQRVRVRVRDILRMCEGNLLREVHSLAETNWL